MFAKRRGANDAKREDSGTTRNGAASGLPPPSPDSTREIETPLKIAKRMKAELSELEEHSVVMQAKALLSTPERILPLAWVYSSYGGPKSFGILDGFKLECCSIGPSEQVRWLALTRDGFKFVATHDVYLHGIGSSANWPEVNSGGGLVTSGLEQGVPMLANSHGPVKPDIASRILPFRTLGMFEALSKACISRPLAVPTHRDSELIPVTKESLLEVIRRFFSSPNG
jgi:hypothetical protein